MNLREKVMISTFAVFMVEALVHYNLGKSDCEEEKAQEGFLPPTNSLIRLALVVGIFSVINGSIIKSIANS